MLTLDLNGQQKSKVDKYNTPYEDLVAGKCEPADPQRLEVSKDLQSSTTDN